jgi:FkbM family methyltransferase
MTLRCRDCDDIPKVPDAGAIVEDESGRVQIMHNGVLVEHGGYFGDWTASIITGLRGHHEPQEEKVFHQAVRRLVGGARMIELGAYWAYYSLWFNASIPDAQVLCCEPDPVNLELGRRNATLNGAKLEFRQGAAGTRHGSRIDFLCQSDFATVVNVPVLSVDGLMAELAWPRLDLLHVDVQGAELDALVGALDTIRAGRIRFVFVSTHHYCISNDPNLHAKCVQLLRDEGGHIITEHTIPESFSGDGLVVASFDPSDRDLVVPVSLNRSGESLFRPYERDLALLMDLEAEAGVRRARDELDAVLNSTSWRVTRPLRAISSAARRRRRMR